MWLIIHKCIMNMNKNIYLHSKVYINGISKNHWFNYAQNINFNSHSTNNNSKYNLHISIWIMIF